MNTAIIIDYSIECDSQMKDVIDATLGYVGYCRVKEFSNSVIAMNGTLTNEEKDYLQEKGEEMKVDYIFLECSDEYYGEDRSDTYTIK